MHKGSANTGTIIFIVLFFLMLGGAGYLYLFGGRISNVTAPVSRLADSGVRVTFVHPVYGYTLTFPYDWKGKYRVVEEKEETQFIYQDQTLPEELLFSIKRLVTGTVASTSDIKRLGERRGFSYLMLVPPITTETSSAQNAKMRRDIYEVANSFVLPSNDPEVLITEKLAEGLFGTSTFPGLTFVAFKSLATEERSTSTAYFVWMLARRFSWDGNLLRDFSMIDQPAAVIIAKDSGEIDSVKTLSPGKNFTRDQKKIFPASVLGSPVFSATTTEHASLMDKLADELEQEVADYFGNEPVLTRVGIVSGVVGSNSPEILVRLAENVTTSANLKVGNVPKTFFIADDMKPLILPAVADSKKLATSTTPSTTITIMPKDLASVFSKNATSTWKKKPFWFETQGGQILRMYPL